MLEGELRGVGELTVLDQERLQRILGSRKLHSQLLETVFRKAPLRGRLRLSSLDVERRDQVKKPPADRSR